MSTMVNLSNGTTFSSLELIRAGQNLSKAVNEHYLVLQELVEHCRNPSVRISSEFLPIFKKYSLTDTDGKVDNVLRNLILSSATGEGMSIKLGEFEKKD